MPGSADRWASHILAVRSCARRKTPLGMWTTQHSSFFLNGYDPRFAISNQKILEWNLGTSWQGAELGSRSRDDSSGHTEFWYINWPCREILKVANRNLQNVKLHQLLNFEMMSTYPKLPKQNKQQGIGLFCWANIFWNLESEENPSWEAVRRRLLLAE